MRNSTNCSKFSVLPSLGAATSRTCRRYSLGQVGDKAESGFLVFCVSQLRTRLTGALVRIVPNIF